MKQESLAQKLRLLRAERGLTLVQASALTGVTRGTLSELEGGKREAYMPTLSKIAEGYGVDVRELLLEEPVLTGPKAEASEEEASIGSIAEAKRLKDAYSPTSDVVISRAQLQALGIELNEAELRVLNQEVAIQVDPPPPEQFAVAVGSVGRWDREKVREALAAVIEAGLLPHSSARKIAESVIA